MAHAYPLELLRRRWLRHLLLAVSLVVVVLSIVGMHQLSVGHDMATGPAASTVQAESVEDVHRGGTTLAHAVAEQAGDHLDTGVSGGGPDDACPDCGQHPMAFGSCLLALTLLVLRWLLAPPKPRHVPPRLVPRLASIALRPAVGRRIPPLSLAELSLLRT